MTVRPSVAWNVLTRHSTPLDESLETFHRYDAPVGRSARFPHGWWILPAFVLSVVFWVVIGMAIFSGALVVLDMVLTGIATAAEAKEVAKW